MGSTSRRARSASKSQEWCPRLVARNMVPSYVNIAPHLRLFEPPPPALREEGCWVLLPQRGGRWPTAGGGRGFRLDSALAPAATRHEVPRCARADVGADRDGLVGAGVDGAGELDLGGLEFVHGNLQWGRERNGCHS